MFFAKTRSSTFLAFSSSSWLGRFVLVGQLLSHFFLYKDLFCWPLFKIFSRTSPLTIFYYYYYCIVVVGKNLFFNWNEFNFNSIQHICVKFWSFCFVFGFICLRTHRKRKSRPFKMLLIILMMSVGVVVRCRIKRNTLYISYTQTHQTHQTPQHHLLCTMHRIKVRKISRKFMAISN